MRTQTAHRMTPSQQLLHSCSRGSKRCHQQPQSGDETPSDKSTLTQTQGLAQIQAQIQICQLQLGEGLA